MTLKNIGKPAAVAISSLFLLTCDTLMAQEVGTRVRVTIDEGILKGDVVERSDFGFLLALSPQEVREISNREIERLEVRTCCVDYAWAYPTLAGMVVGGLGAAYWGDDIVCTETKILGFIADDSCEIHGNTFWWGVLGGGAAGLAAGWTFLRDRWEPIPVSNGSGPTLSPLLDIGSGQNGKATMILGARIRF